MRSYFNFRFEKKTGNKAKFLNAFAKMKLYWVLFFILLVMKLSIEMNIELPNKNINQEKFDLVRSKRLKDSTTKGNFYLFLDVWFMFKLSL